MMWANYALSLYRTLNRHRLYALLNTLGLAFGIAVFTVLALVVRFESRPAILRRIASGGP